MADHERVSRALALLETHEWFEANEALTLWGSITDEDTAQLVRAISLAEAHPGPFVEIGCLFGLTTQVIAAHKSPTRPLITVENFSWNPFGLRPDQHRDFTRRALFYCLRQSNTGIFAGSNREFYASYDGPTPALVFIDADHTYRGVREDIAWAVARRVPVICGHDYMGLYPGVVRAVDEAFAGDISVGGSVWIAQPWA